MFSIGFPAKNWWEKTRLDQPRIQVDNIVETRMMILGAQIGDRWTKASDKIL